MLYPQQNPFRQVMTLPAYWDFRVDPDNCGLEEGWSGGFEGVRPIAVPASWNEQFEGERDFLGPAWHQTRFDIPWGWEGKRIMLRFGSVNYLADVWLNGELIGQHEGGHLPFEFDVTKAVQPEGNTLIVRVDGRLAPDRVPPGNVSGEMLDTGASQGGTYPRTNFDFFPYCGIHRPVMLTAATAESIRDITVITNIEGSTGVVTVRVVCPDGEIRVTLTGHGVNVTEMGEVTGGSGQVTLTVPNAALWSPVSPDRYDLTVELNRGGRAVDRYTLPIGIRTIAVEGDQLLLNGEPIRLVGVARHEDFPIIGRGLPPAVVIKDFALMKWIGANSFRTSHYPYSEEIMFLADRLGFLVIDETPAVGLYFRQDGLARRLELCKQYTQELISRDKNHPSVVMWSLANEPHSLRPEAGPFFRELYDLAKALDPTRPITLASFLGVPEAAFEFMDVLCVNRYHGWYLEPGQLDEGVAIVAEGLDALHAHFGKPVILTEFGADALPGCHAQPPEMFSEEYQAEMLTRYITMLASRPYVVGHHVWNLCDFKTSQGITRMGGMNYKGVFTRDRRPKLAAHALRRLWQE
jgi:beta-glucuronidase